MNKKMSKRQHDIKTKLMAAIAMLLVSSIMMVSTTYAWFTLSTAPEVTGIQTAVGANGNLEMALLPTSGLTSDIKSDVNDSTKPDKERNVTWGNLVDLSDNVTYGLDKITLYPSALNTGDDGKIATSPLKFPQYGADGRVSVLVPNTFTGVYNTSAGSFSPDNAYGVRAVGSASGMTDRQLSYRNAKGAAGAAKSYAAQLASKSLDDNGNALASIAVKKGTATDPKFTQADVNTLQAIVNDLLKTDGILDQIENSYMQYILAYAASAASGNNETGDAAWQYVKGLVEADDATINSVVSGITTPPTGTTVSITIPSQVTDGIAKFNATVAMIDNADTSNLGAKQLLTALDGQADAKGEYTWKQIEPILKKLANPDSMQINGIPAGEIKQGDNMNTLVNSVIGGAGVNVVIASGGGVYADIAEQTENFQADVDIEKIEYSGQTFGPLKAKMKTAALEPTILTNIGTAVDNAGAPASGEAGSVPITDMYGYIIDMAFRTNAASSNLVLQQEAVDRIYTSNSEGVEVNGETTMGHGANMTFKSVNPSFDNDKVKNLMKAIRVVFFDPDTKEVIKYALLDTANTTTTTDGGVKADLVLYDLSEGGTSTVYYTKTETDTTNGGTTYTVYYTDDTLTTPSCRSYTVTTTTGEGETATETKWETANNTVTDGVTATTWTAVDTQPTRPSKEVTTEDSLIKAADNKIMPLTQNTATKLSVLVYLDGETITNSDVAASGTNSVVGEMNLQFSSDGNLTPMNYTPLMNQGGTASGDSGNDAGTGENAGG